MWITYSHKLTQDYVIIVITVKPILIHKENPSQQMIVTLVENSFSKEGSGLPTSVIRLK